MPKHSSVDPPFSSRHEDEQVTRNRQSAGRRMFRSLSRFFIAVLIGVAATLAWQSSGDAARELVAAEAPALAWLLPVSTVKSPGAAALSPDPTQQLAPLSSDLDAIRRSVAQLAAKQDEMAQSIAALQTVDENIREKMSSASPSVAQQATSNLQPKPAQPRAQPSTPPRAPAALSR